jgi:hypothetical protein
MDSAPLIDMSPKIQNSNKEHGRQALKKLADSVLT